MKRTKLFWTLVAVLTSGSSFGQSVPTLINYQGRLVDSEGTPLDTATRNIEVSIYDASMIGTLVWGPETHPNVPIVQGYYNILLGSQASLENAFNGSERFLEVKIDGVTTSPRQRLLSAPYALKSGSSASADSVLAGAITSTMIQAGAVSVVQLASNAVTTAKIAAGAVDASKIAGSAITSEKLAVGAVSTSAIANGSILGDDIAAGGITAMHLAPAVALSVAPRVVLTEVEGSGFAFDRRGGINTTPVEIPGLRVDDFVVREGGALRITASLKWRRTSHTANSLPLQLVVNLRVNGVLVAFGEQEESQVVSNRIYPMHLEWIGSVDSGNPDGIVLGPGRTVDVHIEAVQTAASIISVLGKPANNVLIVEEVLGLVD